MAFNAYGGGGFLPSVGPSPAAGSNWISNIRAAGQATNNCRAGVNKITVQHRTDRLGNQKVGPKAPTPKRNISLPSLVKDKSANRLKQSPLTGRKLKVTSSLAALKQAESAIQRAMFRPKDFKKEPVNQRPQKLFKSAILTEKSTRNNRRYNKRDSSDYDDLYDSYQVMGMGASDKQVDDSDGYSEEEDLLEKTYQNMGQRTPLAGKQNDRKINRNKSHDLLGDKMDYELQDMNKKLDALTKKIG